MKSLFVLLPILFALHLNTSIAQQHLTHSKWNTLLKKHVSAKGNVDYKGFLKDEGTLKEYLTALSNHHPDKSWKKEDRLAFWINAYNAFTVKLILDNYPVSSIKDIGGSIYRINTAWDIKFIKIGDETYDLNNIEHGIIRDEFEEPRIHFALNCAATSCPRLRNEAYVGNRLDAQLDDQARLFINDDRKNKITKEVAKISKIFLWYRGDFSVNGKNFRDIINQYSTVKITNDTKIEYLDYNWSLNE